jgi:hypothetical protein
LLFGNQLSVNLEEGSVSYPVKHIVRALEESGGTPHYYSAVTRVTH